MRAAAKTGTIGACVAVLVAGALSLPAHAAVVDLSDNVLSVRDTLAEDNVLDVRPAGFGTYEAYDDGPPLEGTGACVNESTQLVRCTGFALEVTVDAGAGDDLVGLWDDFRVPVALTGGPGDDALAGGPGNDDLQGGDGDDSLSGGPGNDRSAGELGSDHLSGGAAADTLLGGEGDDIVEGEAGAGDVLLGQGGRDLLLGGPGADQLEGGDDDDALAGGRGRDTVGTGAGADAVFSGGPATDVVDCRAGDEVSGEARVTDPACDATGAERPVPDAWPPPDDVDAAAQASRIVFEVAGRVVRSGDARRFWFWVGSAPGSRYAVDVKVRIGGSGRRLYRNCFHGLWTNEKITRKLPLRARAARGVSGKVLRGRRCR